jgi:F420-dependent oxidoreductase-like protein
VFVGVIVPQGWKQEFHGFSPRQAWERMVAIARQAETLGFQSIWLFDHLQTIPDPADELTFESFTSLSALAALTTRIRIGHIVINGAFRNPALVAKMVATMDVISAGRMELGIGAGWKEDEFRAYGYQFPPTRERLAALRDNLEVITRMLAPGRATFKGTHASVDAAVNEPKGIQQPRVPIMVGGNGPNVTWRLAAKYADELNLDWLSPVEVEHALPVIRSRCEEIERDPATLRVSVNFENPESSRTERVAVLEAYRRLGVSRVTTWVRASVDTDDALEQFAEDVLAAGGSLDVPDHSASSPEPAKRPVSQ